MVNKPGSCNPMQKGERRQQVHKKQNKIGDSQVNSYYENFNEEEIE